MQFLSSYRIASSGILNGLLQKPGIPDVHILDVIEHGLQIQLHVLVHHSQLFQDTRPIAHFGLHFSLLLHQFLAQTIAQFVQITLTTL